MQNPFQKTDLLPCSEMLPVDRCVHYLDKGFTQFSATAGLSEYQNDEFLFRIHPSGSSIRTAM